MSTSELPMTLLPTSQKRSHSKRISRGYRSLKGLFGRPEEKFLASNYLNLLGFLFIELVENLFGCQQGIGRGGEATVGEHLGDDFDNFNTRGPTI